MTMGSNEGIVQANGIDICVETFGDPPDPVNLGRSSRSYSRTNLGKRADQEGIWLTTAGTDPREGTAGTPRR
jgi:hypothetical protein